MKKCENCNIEHVGEYGSGRFCSSKCARGFSTKSKRKEINEKVSKKLKIYDDRVYTCQYCNKLFTKTSNRLPKTCSRSCASNLRGGWSVVHRKLTSEDWSVINKRSYENGNNYVAGGTTKWYNYKDIRVQGTYELRTCKILDQWKLDGKIKDWEYTNDKIDYVGMGGKHHSYLLDFKVFTDVGNYYIETKGYETETDRLKWKSVREQGNKLEVWFENTIKEIENKKSA